MDEKRKKDLYFYCKEKWNLLHICKSPKVYYIHATYESHDEKAEKIFYDSTDVVDSGQTQIIEPNHVISLNALYQDSALTGTPCPSIMRVWDKIGFTSVVILMDLGSTHNFLDPSLVKTNMLLVDEASQLRVTVANGEEMQSPGCCNSVLTTIQSITFCPNFYVLPLSGCDVVLGIHWLMGLGPITWNFTSLSMRFQWAKKWVQLQGIQLSPSIVTNESDNSLISEISKNKGLLLQLMATTLETPQSTCCPDIDTLLLQLDKVFRELVGLPPPRSQDHKYC